MVSPFLHKCLAPWEPSSNCCNWEGITCNPKSGHVIGFDLSGRFITGTIDSDALFGLTLVQVNTSKVEHLQVVEISNYCMETRVSQEKTSRSLPSHREVQVLQPRQARDANGNLAHESCIIEIELHEFFKLFKPWLWNADSVKPSV